MAEPCAGELRHRVTIQEPMETPDRTGGMKVEWADVATCWMKREPMSGREAVHAGRLMAPAMERFTMRYRAGVNEKMRLVDAAGVAFNIRHIRDPMNAHRWLELSAEKDVAQ